MPWLDRLLYDPPAEDPPLDDRRTLADTQDEGWLVLPLPLPIRSYSVYNRTAGTGMEPGGIVDVIPWSCSAVARWAP